MTDTTRAHGNRLPLGQANPRVGVDVRVLVQGRVQ